MKKLQKWVFLLFFLIFGFKPSAQEVTVGTGNSVGNGPFIPYLTASYNQSIYLSSELSVGEITSISYHYVSSETLTVSPVTIYMGEVSNTSFSSTSDRVPLTSLTQVFSGSVTFSSGWVTINLTEPFQYDGDGNLVVAFLHNKGQNLSWEENHFYYTTTTDNKTNAYGVWSGTINVSNIVGGWSDFNQLLNSRPNTKFMFSNNGEESSVCPTPTDVMVNNITNNSALLSWTVPEGISTFGVAMKLASESSWTFLSNVTGNSYILSDLIGLTNYQVKVWTICAEDSLSDEVVKSFATSISPSQISSLPYEESFDDATSISSWLIENENATNQWYWGTAENNTTEVPTGGALYISSNGGVSSFYDNTAPSNVSATKYFNFPEALNFKFAFDVKGLGEGNLDKLSVYIAKGGANLNNNSLLGTYSGINSWERKEFLLDSTYSNQSVRLVFKWENDGSDGASPASAVDNISLETMPCGLVNNLNISFTENSGSPVAIVVVDDPNTDANSYLVEYCINGAESWTSFTSTIPTFDILDLSYATTYAIRVKVLCNNGESEFSPIYYFTTPCGVFSSFPWSEGFEQNFVSDEIGNETSPLCWTQIVSNSSYKWLRNTIYENSGEACVRASAPSVNMPNPPVNSWLISPSIAFTGNEKLSFKLRKQSLDNIVRLKIYTLNESEQSFSQVSDTSRFELLRTIEYNEATTGYSTIEVGLTHLSTRGRFAFVLDTLSNPIIIDDVVIDELPECPDVYSVNATKLSSSSVAISFDTTNSNGSGWIIAYAQASSEEEFDPISTPASQQISITSSSQLPYVIEGLSAGTYYFAVQQDCGGNFSAPATAFFPIVNTLPYTQNFNTNSVAEWDLSNHSGNNIWYIDSCMFISNNGDTNTYDFNSQSKSYAITYISLPASASFTLTYDWIALGQQQYNSAYDYGRVFLLPDTMEIPTNYVINNYAISEPLYQQSSWTTDTIQLDATYANKTWKLIFMWQNNANTGNNPALAVDNISFTANNCGQVVDLGVEYSQNAEVLVANLSFTDYTFNPSYIIEYKANTETEWTLYSATTAPYQITGLQYNTEYTFRVAVECEDGTITPYVSVTSKTPCAAITQLPWGESFNNEPNNCWEYRKGLLTETTYTEDLQVPSQYEMSWEFNSTNQVGGISDGRMQVYLSGMSTKYWLITPTIDLPISELYELSVDVLARSTSDDVPPQSAPDDKFVILISTDNGISWNTTDAIIFNDSDTDTEHNFSQFNQTPTRVKFKLQDSEGISYSGPVRFAFYCESTVSNGNNFFFIDNLAINQWSDCSIPTNLSISNITNNTAQLTFHQDEEVEGWEYIVVAEGASMENATPVEVVESPAIIDNLEAEMNYTVYLRAICSETSLSPWSIGASFLTTPDPTTIPYTCDFDFEAGEATGWLLKNGTCANRWTINEQLFVTADGTTPGYSDGTSVILAEKLFLFGDSDSITISFDLTIGGEIANSAPYDYLKVFLIPETANFEPSSAMQMPQYANADYSQNVILTNTEGGYYVNLITTQTTMNITIPTPQEAHKLVFAWINDDSMGIQPGAIIDNLSITSATESESPCFAPVNLSIENSIDTVAFSWQSAGSETQWEVRLDESTPILVNSTTYQFANIAIGQHTAYVRAICSEETYSQWASIDFEIGNVEPVVTTTEAINITDNSATLTANVQLGSEEITAIGFKYRVANQEEWTIVNYEGENLEEIALEITGLVVATEYEFKAFVACGENEYEGEVKTFTTLASLIDELNSMLSVSLYPNPAKQSTTIELSGMNSDATISIVNMKGQIIKTIEIQPSQSYELNLTDFASGNYYVKIITDNKIITRKLIVE